MHFHFCSFWGICFFVSYASAQFSKSLLTHTHKHTFSPFTSRGSTLVYIGDMPCPVNYYKSTDAMVRAYIACIQTYNSIFVLVLHLSGQVPSPSSAALHQFGRGYFSPIDLSLSLRCYISLPSADVFLHLPPALTFTASVQHPPVSSGRTGYGCEGSAGGCAGGRVRHLPGIMLVPVPQRPHTLPLASAARRRPGRFPRL